jgi:DNA polymerase-3 subunit alpha
MTDFAHLHLHTTYSFLDGACPPKALAKRAAELKMQACAVTDHRHLGGAIESYKALRAAEVKPILGMEANTADHGHLIILARNMQGYDNLRELATKQQHGDIESPDLLLHSEGLAFLTACVGNKVAGACARGDMDRADEALDMLLSVVGNVYLELQPTAGPHLRANAHLQELAEKNKLKCVVTNDVHYLNASDHDAQNVLMAIKQGKRLGDRGLHQHPEPVYFLRSEEEMKLACIKHGIDTAHLATTAELASECTVELNLGTPDLPPFSDDDVELLDDLAWKGLKERGFSSKEYSDRLGFELDVISDMGYDGYFLIVQDFVNWARANGCAVGPGRGSGAGSLVAYSLGITDLDPIEHKLFFERFLNPERISMPDFDIDFMQAKRGEVIDYVVGRWGREHVGQIATYMSLHPKSAIKDVGRVLGMPYGEINEMVKQIPQNLKAHSDEEQAMSEFDLAMTHAEELVERAKDDPTYENLLKISRQLTGCYRQTGKHAGGVVIGREPLTYYTPLTDDGRTQYNMNDVEDVGLVKFDFLGVKTLDVIQFASDEVGVDIRTLVPNEDAVFDMISRGDTWGLFQVESPGMTTMCKELRPDGFNDVVAAVSLFRPGPMESGMLASFIKRKHGDEEVEYAHPGLKTCLADTYGTIVYQEQVMQAAQAIAGYTLGGADILRRAMGKKKPAEMAKQRKVWMDGCKANSIEAKTAEELFDAIEKFAGYGFNRSHAAAYALITYQTAWLKLHHPLPFTSALLTVEGGDQEKLARYVRSARDSQVKIASPDVNLSEERFTVEGDSVRWGLGAIKGVGEAVIGPLISNQPYTDLYDLAERSGLNRSVLKILVYVGACDRFSTDRASLLASLESAVKRGKKTKNAENTGQTSMFGQIETQISYASAKAIPSEVLLEAERKALGVYISGHPIRAVEAITPSHHLGGPEVTGVIVDIFAKRARKSGKMWARITIEDEDKSMKLLCFPDAYEHMKNSLRVGAVLTFEGFVNKDGEFVTGGCRAWFV